MTEFDQIFYHILIDLIFLLFVLWFYFKRILNYWRHVFSSDEELDGI